MWSPILVAALIVAPPVILAVVLLLFFSGRAADREAKALASKCNCPRCCKPTLQFAGEFWGESILYENQSEKEFTGYVFRCGKCGDEFQFQTNGKIYSPTDAESAEK